MAKCAEGFPFLPQLFLTMFAIRDDDPKLSDEIANHILQRLRNEADWKEGDTAS